MHWPSGQKVKGQGHTVMKTVTVARLLVTRAATAVCCCCQRGSACRYDCLCFLVEFWRLFTRSVCINAKNQMKFCGSDTDLWVALTVTVSQVTVPTPHDIAWCQQRNQMAVLCGMPTIQYSTQSARLSVHKLFASCFWRGLVSHDSIIDDGWLPVNEWCLHYLPCCQTASDMSEKFGSKFRVQTVLDSRRMTLNWFQRLKWKLEIL